MNNETSYYLFQIISFKKYFYVSLGYNFFSVFCGGPLVVEALGKCPVCPSLNPALVTSTNAKFAGRPISLRDVSYSLPLDVEKDDSYNGGSMEEDQKNILNLCENKSSDRKLRFRSCRPPIMPNSHFEGFEDIWTPWINDIPLKHPRRLGWFCMRNFRHIRLYISQYRPTLIFTFWYSRKRFNHYTECITPASGGGFAPWSPAGALPPSPRWEHSP